MALKLYGSIPSPFVRRVRLYLENTDYEMVAVNVYDDAERAQYANVSPIKKLPVLKDGEEVVMDSRVIYYYLRQKFGKGFPDTKEQNLLAAMDAFADSLVIIMLGKRSELDVSKDALIFKLQLERLPDILSWLNLQAEEGAFSQWDFPAMSLYAILDWMVFRELYDISDYPALLKILADNQRREIVQATDPRG